MDDNFHLRSMRREIFKSCQTFVTDHEEQIQRQGKLKRAVHVGLVFIHVDLPLQLCLQNNEKRRGTNEYIPPHIITKMDSIFEAPSEESDDSQVTKRPRISFESCTISTKGNFRHENDNTYNNDEENTFLLQLDDRIKKSIHSQQHRIRPRPTIIDIEKSVEQLNIEREKTLKSHLHRVDLLLRSLVGSICKENASLFAKAANDARKSIMIELKQQNGTLSSSSRTKVDGSRRHNDDIADFVETLNDVVAEFEHKTLTKAKCSSDIIESAKLVIRKSFSSFLENEKKHS
mmetsp:Transcript_6132/g.9260  ORF Transcript_6132/g.9260 Transcript_6132/m.9260 type:complete len:289 (+) Transcript_6132:602-1468(+)